ncbi:recombinase family protein [Azospirillum brasilense]|uniref:Recombinase family protein n=1 Tax=Azospirillum brasilense TaxID=192 RepID=A0A6L3AQU3_AZOBR|nr:recombinase family protein [Azospirillum brasilense]
MSEPQIALYARVSSEQQTHSNTIASQLAVLRERIAAAGLVMDPANEFVDDGYSGTTLLRPALERLRDAVAAGVIDQVYVHAPDRLARRYAYQVLLIEEFRRAGVEIVFVNRPIGTSAEDDLLLQVQGMIAEYEHAKILERSRRGRRHAARSGLVSALGKVPFGYRYITKDDGGGMARVEVVADEARWVRLMFAWIGLDRLSLREVCRRLHETGVPTSTGKTHWDATTVALMLRNTAYIGRAVFGRSHFVQAAPRLRPLRGHLHPPRHPNSRVPTPREEWIEIPMPPLVDPVVFEAAQTQLDENRRRRRERRRRPGWLLQGLVVCRQCGYAFYGKMARGTVGGQKPADYGYYRCPGTDAHRFAGQAICHNRSVRSDRLEQAVWDEIRAVLEDPQRLAQEYERRLAEVRDRPRGTDALAGLDHQITSLRRGIGRLIDGYAEGMIDRAEFEPRIGGMKQRLSRLEEERRKVAEDAEVESNLALILGCLEDFAAKVHQSLDELDWTGTREIIRAMVRRIEIDGDHVNVVFRIPPPSSEGGGERPFGGTCPAGDNWQHCRGGHYPPHRCDPVGAERRMGCPEGALYDAGNHRPARR